MMSGGRMGRRGMIYVVSLGIALAITIAGASLLIRSVSENTLSERFRNQSAALHLAEAGVDQAARNLRTPTDATDDVAAASLSTGTFQIDAPVSLGALMWQVKTHGASTQDPGYPRHIEAVFQLTPQSLFQFALFADQNLNVSGSANTDSYDSRNGPYNSATADHDGDVGTNATTLNDPATPGPDGVTVGGSIFIDGQVAVGPDVANPQSVVSGYNAAFITGGTSPPSDTQDVVSQSSALPMPDVVVPAGLTCSDQTITGGTQLTLSPTGGPLGNGTYCYHDLTVQGHGELTASGSVTVYLTGALIARGDSTVGVESDPRQMTLLMSSTSQATIEQGTITGSTEFYGALYGPKATIDIQGNAAVYGSIVAKVVNLTGSAEIHYDEALTDVTTNSNLYRTRLISWRETAN